MGWADSIATQRPLVFAHRGASARYLENTLPAFIEAIALGVDGIELDVQCARDGIVVVYHDFDLTRFTRSHAKIANLDSPTLIAAALRPPDTLHLAEVEYRIPLLREVLELCRGKVHVDIELKGDDPRLPAAVIEVVRATAMAEQVTCTSFNADFLTELSMRAPDLATGYLIALDEQWISLVAHPSQGACVPKWLLTPERADELRSAGKWILVWTLDDREEIELALHSDPDAIVSNHPERVLAVREDQS
ncbi:MAG: glycerophosphodiester phosphodiesterase [bacterium]